MLRPQGYAITTEPGKAAIEQDSLTCAHCNSIVFVKAGAQPSADEAGFCRACYRHICPQCDGAGLKCDPFEKKLERMESRERLLRSLGT